MKLTTLSAYVACFACVQLVQAQATAFTYQGSLKTGGTPVNTPMDIQFVVHSTAGGINPVSGVITMQDVPVTNGLFTVTLDFGNGVFNGSPRWLDISVRDGASVGGFTNLLPRPPITATPYAIYAQNANTANLVGPFFSPVSTAGAVGFGFIGDPNTGLFSTANNVLGLATQGVERVHIDPAGAVGINTNTPSHALTVADTNHQIAVRDTDDASFWTMTTIGGGGFGVYQSGTTQRMAIDSGGTLTVAGGKAVVYNTNSTEVMIRRMTGTFNITNLGVNAVVDGTLTWGDQGYTSPPFVYVGGFQPGPNGLQSFAQIIVTPHSATLTNCKIRLFNAGSTPATLTDGEYGFLVVGNR